MARTIEKHARNEHRCLKPQTHPALSPQNNYYLSKPKPLYTRQHLAKLFHTCISLQKRIHVHWYLHNAQELTCFPLFEQHTFLTNKRKTPKRSFLEILEKGPQMALSKAPLFRCSPRFIFLQFPFAADAKRIWRIFRSRHLFLTSPSVWECEIFILLRVLKGKTRNAISCLFSLKGTRGVLHTTRQIEGGSIYCHLFWGGQDLGCVEL